MKKVLIGFGIGLLLFSGCSSVNPTPKEPQCQIQGEKAPSWVCNGGSSLKGGIFAVGSAESSPLGIGFQREEAVAAARDVLAREIGLKVKNMFKRYLSSTGIGKNQTAERVATEVSKQVSNQVLHGSKLLKTWVAKNGVMYVLVGIKDNDKLKETIKNTVKTTFRNDEALWQEFKAKKAQDELESEIEKEF